MKKMTIAAACVFAALGCLGNASLVQTEAKAVYVCDADSGTPVFAEAETERLPIASMCKVMTLLLAFEAVDEGELKLDEQIEVSEHAAGMGGSQSFSMRGSPIPRENF